MISRKFEYLIALAKEGHFARAAAVLASRGQTVRFALRSAGAPCPDYGSDLVTATPPIAGIAALSSSCPNRALTNLISDLETAMALPK